MNHSVMESAGLATVLGDPNYVPAGRPVAAAQDKVATALVGGEKCLQWAHYQVHVIGPFRPEKQGLTCPSCDQARKLDQRAVW